MYINVLCHFQFIQTVGSKDVRNVMKKYLTFCLIFYFAFVFLKLQKQLIIHMFHLAI